MPPPADPVNWLRERRSIRRYRPEPLPPSLLDQLLNAGIWAPSAHNRQPWRFAVIQNDAIKQKLAAAMGAEVTVLSRSDAKADDATRLGAAEFIATALEVVRKRALL